jgi:hypothetical protein
MRELYIDDAAFSEQVAKLDSTFRLIGSISLGLVFNLTISVSAIISYATDKSAEPYFFRDRPAFDPFPCIFLFVAAIVVYWVWKPWPAPPAAAPGAPLLVGDSNVQRPAYNTYGSAYVHVSNDASA